MTATLVELTPLILSDSAQLPEKKIDPRIRQQRGSSTEYLSHSWASIEFITFDPEHVILDCGEDLLLLVC